MNLESIYYPMFVHVQNETKEEIIARWDVFNMLPENIQDKISGDDTADRIKSMSDNFNLAPIQIMAVSRAIRRYYFGEISREGILVAISQETGLRSNICEGIYKTILEKIIYGAHQETAKIISMTISEALKTYPEIGEQAITSEKLELKSFPYPVRPSINNWISDYTFTVGFNNTNPMIRGNYLFRNKNTERLTEEERNRLSQILKSLDENAPISIDESRHLVVFLKMENPEPRKQPPVIRTTDDDDDILKERLSAWRTGTDTKQNQGEWNVGQKKDPQQINNAHPESRMIFSSPQRLPIEKDIPKVSNNAVFQKSMPISDPTPQTSTKIYSNEPIDLSNIKMRSAGNDAPAARNVVNLREE